MKTRKIISESRLGLEYVSDVIETCNKYGIECIADDNDGVIYYYDPKNHKFGDDRLLNDNDFQIFDISEDKEAIYDLLFDAEGELFKRFAVEWNRLQKKGEDEEVYKTDHCNPIRGKFTEDIDDEQDSINGIPNWSTVYIMYGDDSGLTDEDKELVDNYVRKLERDGIRLVEPIEGTENEFNSRPAFGDACDTTDWLIEVGKMQNESIDDNESLSLDEIPENMTFEEGFDFYNELYDAYNKRRINYNEFRVMYDKLKDSVVNGLLKTSSLEKLGEEWFKDYGTENGWDSETSFRYAIASKIHDIHKAKHPDEHKRLPQRNSYRGWSEDNCSCGLCSSCDSSD